MQEKKKTLTEELEEGKICSLINSIKCNRLLLNVYRRSWKTRLIDSSVIGYKMDEWESRGKDLRREEGKVVIYKKLKD